MVKILLGKVVNVKNKRKITVKIDWDFYMLIGSLRGKYFILNECNPRQSIIVSILNGCGYNTLYKIPKGIYEINCNCLEKLMFI